MELNAVVRQLMERSFAASGGQAALQPLHMHAASFQVNIGQFQPHRFTHAQAVAEHEQDQTPIAGFVPRAFSSGQQLRHLQPREMPPLILLHVLFWHFSPGHPFVSCWYSKTHEKASKTPLHPPDMRQIGTIYLMSGSPLITQIRLGLLKKYRRQVSGEWLPPPFPSSELLLSAVCRGRERLAC
jgi:hypothetical protein